MLKEGHPTTRAILTPNPGPRGLVWFIFVKDQGVIIISIISHRIHGTGIFTCIWMIFMDFMVNVSAYTIHGSYGFGTKWVFKSSLVLSWKLMGPPKNKSLALSGFHSEQNALQPYFEGWKTCSGGMLFFSEKQHVPGNSENLGWTIRDQNFNDQPNHPGSKLGHQLKHEVLNSGFKQNLVISSGQLWLT